MLTFLWIFSVHSIQVKYAPKLAVAIVQGAADNGRIPEGNSIKLLCNSNANPNNVVYQWYMNDVQIVDATFNELVIFRVTNVYCLSRRINFYRFVLQEILNVTRHYQNAVVKCQAQNSVGIGMAAVTLDVMCMCIRCLACVD